MKNFRRILSLLLVMALMVGFVLPIHATTGATNTESINEKLGPTVVIYGETLSEEQKDQVREMLGVTNPEAVEEYEVLGEDVATYINGNPDANLYSSAKITRQEEGNGLTINIVSPDNITEVSEEMYANALLTAGVENATVDVASPVKVSGHSALTGIYKAYDVQGEELDKERMELANEELDVATSLADNEGLSQEKVSQLLTEIKQMIAEQNPATREDVEQIVSEQLQNLEITLSEADRQMLIDLFDKMRNLNIDFGQVANQLEDIANQVVNKAEELGLDQNFWEKVANFFADIFTAIGNFLGGLFK
ncbi:DUF1002 domain-containing protein [Oceanobacillus piezotolerans]|uniref:DUF1002 domain-containing protein n=1 Tax=Oceanobacillus piezotolerans TaxID=2448030 RepID=A0A498D5Y6_9BACI|nr:DUF1002 domain-containing protein [Oceanobacillus piezotolerans]RLL42810.1 DUF1002 domain-containing protein [Oceanobacillus piezotolerans]